MKIIEPSFLIEELKGIKMLKRIEIAGRACYQSSHKVAEDSYLKFIKMIITNGHESVLEHEKITVRFICDRGVSHELVRHRLASFSQESTRFCNYSKDSFGKELTFIKPSFWQFKEDSIKYRTWLEAMSLAEKVYLLLIELGASPQEARSVLPNSLKTEIVITANLREWRLILKQRTSVKAHPQMRELMVPLLQVFKDLIPVVFDDV